MGVFPAMISVIPEGAAGDAQVVHRMVTKEEALVASMRARLHGQLPVPPGPLCQLRVGGQLMMSDAPEEKRTNGAFVRAAHGDVLVAGLGLGMALVPVLKWACVRSVTVLEKSRGVIDLVEAPLRRHVGKRVAKKLTVIQTDALTWEPPQGAQWDTIYFDIWPVISCESLLDIWALQRRYGKHLRAGGWMKAWLEDELRREWRKVRGG